MNEQDYKNALSDALARLASLATERDKIDIEIDKLKQFIYATINMLPDEYREEFVKAFDAVAKRVELRNASLTEAIKQVLQASPKQRFTATEVRDRLKSKGFDFTSYESNPLASVSTTLRRMKPQDVEMIEVEGVATYRWKRLVDRVAAAQKAKLRSASGQDSPPRAAWGGLPPYSGEKK